MRTDLCTVRIRRRRSLICAMSLGIALATSVGWADSETELASAIAGLASATPDPSGAIDAAGLELNWGHGRLQFTSGVLIPVRVPDDVRVFEAIFVGTAVLRVKAPDSVEAHQLAAFSGAPDVERSVQSAILINGDRWFETVAAERPSKTMSEPIRQAAGERFRSWSEDAEREGFGARTALLLATLGDAAGLGYRAAWFDSAELGGGFYAVDPSAAEAEQFGGYELFDDADFQTRRRQKQERRWERDRIRLEARLKARPDAPAEESDECVFGEEIDEEQSHDIRGESFEWIKIWMSSKAASNSEDHPSLGFESERYKIDMNLVDLTAVTGTTRIELRAGGDGLRVIPLRLEPKVGICAVQGVGGRSLPFVRREGRILVVLDKPIAAGQKIEVEVRTKGEPIEHLLGRRTQRDTIHWHPHVGEIDRATYDVSLRWKADLELLAGGMPIDEGAEEGVRWTRRRMDTPGHGFTFEIDDFEVIEEKLGDIALTFGFPKHSEVTAEIRSELMNTVKASLMFYESQLVPRTSRRLTVVVVPRGFSQGLPGFLTLAERMMTYMPVHGSDNRSPQEYRMEVVAHEVAHQWWGDRVSWEGYRDQWLSEALAEFSAEMFLLRVVPDPDDFLHRRAMRLQVGLQKRTPDGRPLGSLGPVVLGQRLAFNHGVSAYSNVIYHKGSAVFGALANLLGPAPTLQMLGKLAEAVNHRTIETSTFFAGMERMSGQPLNEFVDRYVRGSGLSTVFASHRIEQDPDGSWWVRGTLRQLPSPDFRFVVMPAKNGWDVVRRIGMPADPAHWEALVPIQIVVDGPQGGAAPPITGDVKIRGEWREFEIPLESRPTGVVWDPRGDFMGTVVLLGKVDADAWTTMGLQLQALGRTEEAGEALDQALTVAADSRRPSARARLARMRMMLDQGEDAAAGKEWRVVEDLLSKDPDFLAGERVVLRSRFHARAGRPDLARDEIRRYMAKHGDTLTAVRADQMLDASHLTAIDFVRGELLGLTAACAYANHERDTELVVRMARIAGVEVTALAP